MTSVFLRQYCAGITSVSKNMREFLNYFGQYYDPMTTIVADTIYSSTLQDSMTVIDPLNKSNNLTRSAFKITEI